MKQAQSRFIDAQSACDSLDVSRDTGKDVLVPLTSSMYVSGKLSGLSNNLVDIGTGYYIEKDLDQTKEFLRRKVDEITATCSKMQEQASSKAKQRQMVVQVMQQKYMAAMAQQQSQ